MPKSKISNNQLNRSMNLIKTKQSLKLDKLTCSNALQTPSIFTFCSIFNNEKIKGRLNQRAINSHQFPFFPGVTLNKAHKNPQRNGLKLKPEVKRMRLILSKEKFEIKGDNSFSSIVKVIHTFNE